MAVLFNDTYTDITYKIDQLKLEASVNLIANLLDVVYINKLDSYWIRIFFNDNIDLLSVDFKLSSRLSNVGIEMTESSNLLYEYKNLKFTIDNITKLNNGKTINEKSLRIIFRIDSFKIKEVNELIEILFEQNIIWVI